MQSKMLKIADLGGGDAETALYEGLYWAFLSQHSDLPA